MSHCFARGLHLRSQHRVEPGQLEPGKGRDLHCYVPYGERALQGGQRLPQHRLHGEPCQRHAGRLGDERQRAAGTRIGLEQEQLAAVHRNLQVGSADDPQRAGDLRRKLDDFPQLLRGE